MGMTPSSFRSGLLAVLAVGATSCAPAGIRANMDTPAQGPDGALACATLDQPMDTLTIGPEGGTISAGPHTLRIPPGALEASERARFTIVHPPRSFVVVSVTPHGKTFKQGLPAELTLSYAHCPEPATALAIYRSSPDQTGWEKISSQQDTSRKVVEARLQSLSSYALGAN